MDTPTFMIAGTPVPASPLSSCCGFAEADARSHRLLRCDARFSAMTGCDPSQLPGTPWPDLVHPMDRSLAEPGEKAIAGGHDTVFECRLAGKDGGSVWANISGPFPGSGEAGAPDVVHIRCWPLAQGAAGRRQARLFDSLPDPVIFTDLNGSILDINSAAAQVYGYPLAVLAGQPLWLLHPDQERETVAGMLAACCAGELNLASEAVRVTREGAEIASRVAYSLIRTNSGQPDSVTVTAVDISLRKTAEAALERSEALSRLLLENATQAIIVSDRRGGIIHANATAVRLFGYQREELVGASIELLVPASARWRHSSFRQQFYHGAISRPMGEGAELHAVCKDGSEIDVEIGLSSVMLGDETLVAAFISDVRLRRGHEEQIRKSRRQLQDLTERLIDLQEEEKRYLARELHDDFSQRLAGLRMEVSMLADSLEGEADTFSPAQMRGRLQRMGNRISELARDCHELSRRLHSSVLEKVGLAAALQTEADEYLRREGLRVKLDVTEGLQKLPAEAALCLYRVAQEALRNIVLHSGVNEARLEITRDASGLCMTISDSGTGFDPENIAHSRGLGLISMRERVRLLGGRLRLDTAPGRGVSITVGIAWPIN